MQEQIFLQENGVTVSQVRFVTPSQTFAMQGITSIARNLFRPSKKKPVGTMLFGAVIALIGLGVFLTGNDSSIIGSLLGVVMVAWGLRQYLRLKPDHQVILNASTTAGTSRTTGGGMVGGSFAVGAAVTGSISQNFVVALSSKDGEFISRVVDALNEALVTRG